ncbi:MAG: hypothetical protein RL154_470 [Pseudomonadota bacterium]|jgi:lysophospholipase L1-like esterase
MKTAVILKENTNIAGTKELLALIFDYLAYHTKRLNCSIDTIFARESDTSLYLKFTDMQIEPYDKKKLSGYENIILLGGYFHDWHFNTFTSIGAKSVYNIDWTGALRSYIGAKQNLDFELETHIFNKLGPKNHIHAFDFYYFPYGYIYRDASWGPINAFGHRINFDFNELKARDKNHVVVACFGGSTAWGWQCIETQVWTYYLEQMLNQSDNTKKYTVLNFALPGNVVLNEIMHYVNLCYGLKPEVVISLSGANDLFNGQASDEYLLEKYNITYQQNLENWSVDIHKSDINQTHFNSSIAKTMISKNQPLQVINAYVSRIRQFKELSKASNAKFIWAFQPMSFDKKTFSNWEADFMKSWNKHDDKEMQNRLVQLYRALIGAIPNDLSQNFINCHDITSQSKEWLYWDSVHLNANGQKLIASLCFDYIKQNGYIDE